MTMMMMTIMKVKWEKIGFCLRFVIVAFSGGACVESITATKKTDALSVENKNKIVRSVSISWT